MGQSPWERATISAGRLFRFLCTLKCEEIPEFLLLRMMTSTNTWGRDGVVESNSVPMVDPVVDDLISGIAYPLLLLFSSIGLIQELSGATGRKVFKIPASMQLEFGPGSLEPEGEWSRLVLVCHAFPGRHEEPWLERLLYSITISFSV